MRAAMVGDGFEASGNSHLLRRYALERRDLSYEAFLQSVLSPKDWGYQQLARPYQRAGAISPTTESIKKCGAPKVQPPPGLTWEPISVGERHASTRCALFFRRR